MLKTVTKTLAAGVAVTALLAGAASAQTTLRIQTHQGQSSSYGGAIQEFVDAVNLMSGGDLQIEMFYSSSVVPSAETFDAAVNSILDCDMTNGSYQAGKNKAFQFVSDTMGGYDSPLQYQAWVEMGGGREAVNELYADYNMTFVGAHVGGQESLTSTRPLAGVADLENWKFRAPPGMASDIFASLGAKPIVMDFSEVITALESGIIDGADASTLGNNLRIGTYDIGKHTNFPGFHSMAADHLACRTDVWEGLSEQHRKIIEVAYQNVGMDLILQTLVDNGEALAKLPGMDVTTYNWSAEDRATFRAAAQKQWDVYGGETEEGKAMVASHVSFMKRIGLIQE
ncbi:TRAP transporter substrate-binding protein [Tropicibacter sp. R15_0]|uniref:TRAP transporter substrate-binding protein n=1 Tax=Tropicibacter sp. R15_0 TaxID=2821101 RepID=UPI001ADB35DB|nr:TRAP transporter substrate-binding protein [Tropicibacter sp. R15_0]MBO9467315.1 TRAP transporter substrate-binding protein [Tropicibacter sp. R15_0]